MTLLRRFGFWAAVIAASVGLASCSTPYEEVEQEVAANVETGDYVIGPLDMIEVFVWRAPDVSVRVPVRPDGKISTPLVDCLLYTSPSPRDGLLSRMPSSA